MRATGAVLGGLARVGRGLAHRGGVHLLGAVLALAAGNAVNAQQATPTATGLPVKVFAAGSLRDVFTAIAADHRVRTGDAIDLSFGASGLLRERIEQGEAAQVFASADVDHPQRLAQAGGWSPPVVFARNALCALVRPGLSVETANLLETLLRPGVRLGTSTPRADPSGDYAWQLFRKADALRPGAYAALDAKALKLTGGADSPRPPAGRNTYAWVMDSGQADVFLTYCTNAVIARREVAGLQVVQVPQALQVGAAYGLTVRQGASPEAQRFARALMEAPAQQALRDAGFGAAPGGTEPAPQGQGHVDIRGAVVQARSWTTSELRALPQVTWSERRRVVEGAAVTPSQTPESQFEYRGVRLRDLIERAGIKADRREQRRTVILATAQDGYQASFSWGELFNSSLGDSVVLVLREGAFDVIERDGLPALRSLQDLRSGPRHVRWLARIEVLLP